MASNKANKRKSHPAPRQNGGGSKKSKFVEEEDISPTVIPPGNYGRILQSVLNHLRKGQTIELEAAQLFQLAVEKEVIYLLRDAGERAFENDKTYPNGRNIEGAIELYSRYRDDDVLSVYNKLDDKFLSGVVKAASD